jgi:hypothetical protein
VNELATTSHNVRLLLGFFLIASGIIITDTPAVYGQAGLIAPGLGSAMIVMGAILIGFFLQSRGWHK